MYQHVRPLHLIGALSPADVQRLVIRLVEVSGQRTGEPEPGEPMLRDVTLTCSPLSVGDGPTHVELSAAAPVAGGGEARTRFLVEVHFVEGRQRAVDDPGSLEVVKELASPGLQSALHALAHMLTASVEMRMTARPRIGLLDRVRWWAARRLAAASR